MSEQNLKCKDIDKLEFLRIFTPDHIPKYLVDQIRDKEFTTEKFYDYQRICCVRQTDNGPILNPMNFLYVIANEDRVTKGFLWAQSDPLCNYFFIQNYSIDKEYWNNGKAVKFLVKKVKEIVTECKMRKVFWITNFPKHSQRYGFRRSKHTLMEFDPCKEEVPCKAVLHSTKDKKDKEEENARILDTNTTSGPGAVRATGTN